MRKLGSRIAGSLMLLSWTAAAVAQRGDVTPGNPGTFTNPTQGFPGFFDTNFAEHGSVVMELPPLILPFIPVPSVAIDYGVTDTFTVGTNALISTLPWLAGGQGLSVKARTLVYGSENFMSAATIYGGYVAASSLSSSYQMLTSNNTWKIAPRHIASAQAMFLSFGLENGEESSLDYTNLRFSTLGLGGGYQFLLSDTMALSAYTLISGMTSTEADTVSQSLSANVDPSSGEISWGLVRASMDIHTEDDWVYSIGGLYVFGPSAGFLPWFSATRRW